MRRVGWMFALLMMAPAAAAGGQGFVAELPEGVPNPAGWEKVSGSAELDTGAAVSYEFYVHPHRRARYEVIRYRVEGWEDGRGGAPYRSTERLQWQAGDRDLRRYECEPQSGGGCRWRQLDQDSAEYRNEVPVVLWVLDVHRRLLRERDAGRIP